MNFNLFKKKKESEKKTLDDFICKDEDENEEVLVNEENEESREVKMQRENLTALVCFGWQEEKTEKWLIKCAKVWFLIMSFFYFLFGAVTFAPIIFISHKIDVIFNDKKKSLLIGTIIYIAIIALMVLIFAIRQDNSDLPIA